MSHCSFNAVLLKLNANLVISVLNVKLHRLFNAPEKSIAHSRESEPILVRMTTANHVALISLH